MATYRGQFRDIYENLYTVTLVSATQEAEGHENDIHPLVLGANPVVITTESDGLFSPIKSRGCTIEFVTKSYHFDLYSPKSREVSVLIEDENHNTIFFGYLVPNSYDQDYTYMDTVQLNAVEALSTLKDYTWKAYWNDTTEYLLAARAAEEILGIPHVTPQSTDWHGSYATAQGITYYVLKGYSQQGEIIEARDYISFLDLILLLLSDCGYSGDLYVHNSYTRVNTKTLNELNAHTILDILYVAASNFYDDDAARTPWNLYEVLEEVMKFLNMSIIPFGDDVYIVDYRYLAEKKEDMTFTVYHDILFSEHTVTTTDSTFFVNNSISEVEAPGTPSLSIDDIYNKIDISSNLYTLDKIAPNLFEEKNHISITEEMYLDENEWQWTKQNYKKFLGFKYNQSTTVTGYTYQTICRFDGKSGWVHHFYKHSDLSLHHYEKNPYTGLYPSTTIYVDGVAKTISLEDKDYYDKDSTSAYGKVAGNKNGINQYCNTIGCLPMHYGYVKELGPNNLPATFDWTDILAFFILDDTIKLSDDVNKGELKIEDITKLELPVLDYTIDEEINYKPSIGTSWITIGGDLFYQYNGADYETTEGKKKRDQSLTIINDDINVMQYCTCPVDKAVPEVANQNCYSVSRDKYSAYYGTGFGLWKMRLQIGDKYWKDEWNPNTNKYETGWTSTPTDFYVRYNNNPEEGEDESLSSFNWMSTCSNVNYKDKVGVDAYCIPIAADDNNAPSFGRLYLTVYTPTLIPVGQINDPFNHSYKDMRTWFFSMFNNGKCSWKQLPPVIYAKNFELGYVYTDENVWYKQQSNTNTPDRVYSGNIDLGNVKSFSNLEFKINTEHQSTPISRSYVATNNGYLHSLEHSCTDSVVGQNTNDQVQEYNVIDAYVIHHSDRKPIYTANIQGYHAPYEMFNYGQYLLDTDFSTGISVPYNFVIDTQDFDLKYNRSTIKMIAF